jgi:hypothetical protein
MGTSDQPLGLNNPGVCLRLINKIRDNPTAPIGLSHFDADAPVILRDQPVYRIHHVEHYGSAIANFNRPARVWPLLPVVVSYRETEPPPNVEGCPTSSIARCPVSPIVVTRSETAGGRTVWMVVAKSSAITISGPVPDRRRNGRGCT